MKVLLLYPRMPETFWSFSSVLKFVRRKASMPPLGLLTIAGMLPADWELKLCDQNVRPLKDHEIEWADMVFLSAMIVQREDTENLIERVRAKGKRLVAGGPMFSNMPEAFGQVDHLVLGEAEETLPRFLNDLAAGRPERIYRSTAFPDMNTTPLPRWDLIEGKKDYYSMTVQFSRGCPFDCEFCDITALFGRRPRTKSTERMVEEFEHLYRGGWRGSVFLVDDNFIGNKKASKAFLAELAAWSASHGHPFRLTTEASVNLADDPELMDLMAETGFINVFLGLETPSEESLAECGKTQNQRRDLVEAVKEIQRHGLQVQGGFIIGFDNDPPDIFERQIRFIQESGVTTAMVGLLSAVPGTKLYKRLKAEGRVLGDSRGNNCEGQALNFIPVMDPERLLAGYRHVLKTIYEPRVYYQRIRTFFKNYQPRRSAPITLIDIYAFFMAIWHLGIRDRGAYYRWHFWRLLAGTLVRQPRMFAEAVVQAVYGLHFRKIISEP